MTKEQVKAFCDELTALCQKHGACLDIEPGVQIIASGLEEGEHYLATPMQGHEGVWYLDSSVRAWPHD